MCGIVAVMEAKKQISRYDKKLFTNILKETEVRGSDSTGIYDGKILLKGAMPASSFISSKEYQKWEKSESKTKLLMGHCRAATHGSASDLENDHPIVSQSGRYVIVHNGVVDGSREKDYKYKGETDTEIMLSHIDLKGFDGISDISGSAAVIIHDTKEDKIYVYRDTNPMILARKDNRMIIGSTTAILKNGIGTDGQVLFSGWEFMELPENKLYVYNSEKNNFEFVKEIEMKAYYYSSPKWYGMGYDYGYGHALPSGNSKWDRCKNCPFYKNGHCNKYDQDYFQVENCPFAENGYKEVSVVGVDKDGYAIPKYDRCKNCPYFKTDGMCSRYLKRYWRIENCPFAENGYKEPFATPKKNEYAISRKDKKFLRYITHLNNVEDSILLYGEDAVRNIAKVCKSCPFRNNVYCKQMQQLVVDAVENCPYINGGNSDDNSTKEIPF